ncbi:MAG: DNA/RNA nuclease SfsA [Thermoplasmata archaeon]|nr:DNA/RNA nuclease SfsA [Thermoplasmata archaeon]MCI4362233.1 DNA/RNA nuclease SfsA [Thermoplasmata archaeon]
MTVSVRYPGRPTRVRVLERPNRFLVVVRDDNGRVRRAHLPNPGRMEELLIPGETIGWVVPAPAGRNRSTDSTLVAVRHGRTPVSVDTGIATRLLGQALGAGALVGIRKGPWRPEVRQGRHRFDFGIPDRGGTGWRSLLEVKSSNLRVGSTALFPDAPTERGRRHLEALAGFVGNGRTADVVFAIQRDDVTEFRPNTALDPAFSVALQSARDAGVRLRAITLRVRPGGATLGRPVPVVLSSNAALASY